MMLNEAIAQGWIPLQHFAGYVIGRRVSLGDPTFDPVCEICFVPESEPFKTNKNGQTIGPELGMLFREKGIDQSFIEQR